MSRLYQYFCSRTGRKGGASRKHSARYSQRAVRARARSHRPSGRRTAYICAASSAAALAVPQSHSVVSGRRRAHTSMEKTATAAQSRRRPRGVHALVSSVRWCRARVASLAVARTTSCRASGTVLAAQHSCVGRWDRISIDQITPAMRYVSALYWVLAQIWTNRASGQ